MAKDELLKHTETDVDLYDFLGVPEDASEAVVNSAYRKNARKYHSDKVKDDNPENVRLFQFLSDTKAVLCDPELRAKYDGRRNAKQHAQRQNALFSAKRRQMAEELEAREREGNSSNVSGVKRPRDQDSSEQMIRELAERGRKKREQHEREKRVARTSESSTDMKSTPIDPGSKIQNPTASEVDESDDRVADLERKIQQIQAEKARKKAEKMQQKSGKSRSAESPQTSIKSSSKETLKSTLHPALNEEIKADNNPSAPPKFSFSPTTSDTESVGIMETIRRLKEHQKLADAIRLKETLEE